MMVTIHVSSYYDWEPVPADVVVTDSDIKSGRVKPSGGGGWLMRVTKKGDTQTTVALPEEEVINAIIGEMTRGDKTHLTRAQAVSRYLSRHVLHHHAHRNWFKHIEVDGDQPDEALFLAMLAPHIAAGNIEEEDVESLTAAYMTPATNEDHCRHLHQHFGMKTHKHSKGEVSQ